MRDEKDICGCDWGVSCGCLVFRSGIRGKGKTLQLQNGIRVGHRRRSELPVG